MSEQIVAIKKDSKLYCPECKALLVTVNRDLFHKSRIKAEYFNAGEGQLIEPNKRAICKCGFHYFQHLAETKNWEDKNV
jgi:hypothetical protein